MFICKTGGFENFFVTKDIAFYGNIRFPDPAIETIFAANIGYFNQAAKVNGITQSGIP